MFNFDIFKFQDKIGEPPWEYDFLLNLDESEYPKYLEKIFKYRTGETLPLLKKLKVERGKLKDRRVGCRVDFSLPNIPNILNIFDGDFVIDKTKCKTFNQKIQWIKLYGVTDLMRKCTDKVAVRDYVAEKIGSEYLKPVLQICDSFDEIDFEKLPNQFVMKCNHGSKWQYIIKDKEDYVKTPAFIEITRRNMTGWLEQEFWTWEGFEMQYKGIEPKILIEPLLRDRENAACEEIFVFCFSGKGKLAIRLYGNKEDGISLYDEELNLTTDIFNFSEPKIKKEADEKVRLAVSLAEKLSKEFKFVRVDFMVYQNKLYFEELTFTPYSGFKNFTDIESELRLGKWLNLDISNSRDCHSTI